MRWHRRPDSPASIECQELVEHVTDYLEGALSSELRARIDRHLADCDECTEFLRQMRQTAAAARGAEVRTLDPAVKATLLEAFRSQRSQG